jgi:DNA-binding MarR family transcriptional regulator
MSLTPVQKDVLVHLLEEGDDIPANIAEGTGRHSKSVSRCITGMGEESLLGLGFVSDKGRGVYTLTEDGRERAESLVGRRG